MKQLIKYKLYKHIYNQYKKYITYTYTHKVYMSFFYFIHFYFL